MFFLKLSDILNIMLIFAPYFTKSHISHMDRNTIIGFSLIALIWITWSWYTLPSKEQIEQLQKLEQTKKDSLENIRKQDSISLAKKQQVEQLSLSNPALKDSIQRVNANQTVQRFGDFAQASVGVAQDVVIENDVLKLTFSTKGGKLKVAELKKHVRYDLTDPEYKRREPMKLLEDPRNYFGYELPLASGKNVFTDELYFTPTVEGKTVIMRAFAGEGKYFEQKYTLADGYEIDYDITLNALDLILAPNINKLTIRWDNFVHSAEKNPQYEQTMTSAYFKKADDSPEHCSCTGNDEQIAQNPIKWVSDVQQFFHTTLIADNTFGAVKSQTVTQSNPNDKSDIKQLYTLLDVPYTHKAQETFGMKWIVGPTDYHLLKAQNVNLEEIIPFGWSIFGTINRWIVRPFFDFLVGIFGSLGWCIILMTLLVKLLLWPLQYKMVLSGVKMSILRPQLAKLKEKYGDDQTKFGAEQMKLYGLAGVNPLGGCLPAFMQMPIWLALYRFFPSSIGFRQEGFLWADDLVNFDSVVNFGFNMPLIGAHLSLFTVLWVISMIYYAWYNSKLMDTSMTQNNPVLQYMPYFFPIIFFFALNSYASGLTCYMLFSNIFNIAQTMITKNLIINEDKVKAEMEENMKNPKKKTGFQARLEEAMKAQQAKAQEQQQNKGKK
jgi:YidC/Oxa1 family membrane protein insertase